MGLIWSINQAVIALVVQNVCTGEVIVWENNRVFEQSSDVEIGAQCGYGLLAATYSMLIFKADLFHVSKLSVQEL